MSLPSRANPVTLTLKSPTSAHVAPTPHTPYAWSASATAPVHIDLHIPLILLGSKEFEKKVVGDDTTGPGDIGTRLQLLVRALKETGIAVILWNVPSQPEKLYGTETDEERRAIETSRKNWKQGEERKKATTEQENLWALRATPQSKDDEPFGVHEGWRVGDGLLTKQEEEFLARDEDVWALPFTLQRFSLLLKDKMQWEGEVRRVIDALEKIGEIEHPELGRMLAILASERCHPHITFRQAAPVGGAATPWDEPVVKNSLLLMTAFERELGVLATPEFLLTYKPLSNLLTKREVRKLRRERREIWRKFWEAMADDRRKPEEGRLRRRRRWDRKILMWIGHLEEEDKMVQRREELLGEEGQAWWQKLYAMFVQGEAADVVKDIAKRTKDRGGSRTAFSIDVLYTHDQNKSFSHVTNVGETTIDAETQERQLDKSASHHRHDPLYLDPTHPHEFPPVVALSFPIPASSPLLSYVELCSRIVQIAVNHSEETILPFLNGVKRNEKRAPDTPLEGLIGLAKQMGCEEERVDDLKAHVQQHMQEDEARSSRTPEVEMRHSLWPFESHVKKMCEQGSRAIISVPRHAREDAASNQDNGTGLSPLTYLERYEYVDGYLAISKIKTLRLLEAEDRASKETKVRKDITQNKRNENANVEAV